MTFTPRWLTLALVSVSLVASAFAAAPVISTSDWPTSAQKGGDPFAYQIKASDSPTSYDATGLPAGLTINRTTGQISGTLPTPATTTFVDITLQAANASGSGTARVTLFIQIPTRFVPPPSGWSQTAIVNADYTFRPQITGGAPTWPGFRATGLPAGLSFEPSTGVISGRPTAAGNYPITLTVTNEVDSDTATLALTVVNEPSGPPVIQNADVAPDVYISDRGRDTFAYFKRIQISATNFPTGFGATASFTPFVFDATRAEFVLDLNNTPPGLHSITLTATNSKGTGSKTIRWPVQPRVMDINFVEPAAYFVGDTITLQAKFNGPVVVTGAPSIEISPRHRIVYASGSGTDTLLFTRRTTPDDYFPAGVAIQNEISLNSGTIAHPSGPAAVLTVSPPPLQNWLKPHDGVYLPPPVITSGATASGEINQSFQFALTATNRPTGFAIRSGALPAGLTLNVTTGLISGTPTQTGTFALTVVATSPAPPNGTGTATSAPATLTVTIAPATTPPPTTTPPPPTTTPPPPTTTPPPPVVTMPPPTTTPPPTSAVVAQTIEFLAPVSSPIIGQPFLLSATSSANLPVTLSVVSGPGTVQNNNALIVTGPGAVVVRATQSGNATTAPASAEITIADARKAPQSIAFSPPPAKLTTDAPFPLRATASSGLPVTFALVSGPATLDAGTVTLTGAPGTVTLRATQSGNDATAPAEVTVSFAVNAAPTSRLANLSARLHVSDDDPQRAFITGFVIAGTQPQRVLIRASGPALTGFGVQGALGNPRLQLFDTTGRVIAENDDWSGADTRAAATQLGAFALRDGSPDAAVLVTLEPGPYTARVLANGGSGVALTEIYDASTLATSPARPPLVNLSTRGFVGTGENALAVGFVIAGDVPKTILVRGLGPALAAFGLTALADPLVTVQHGDTALAANDDWHAPASPTSSTAAALSAAATAAGAFPLAVDSKDAALLLTLPPGAYTALVRGAADTTGLALVEVYELASATP